MEFRNVRWNQPILIMTVFFLNPELVEVEPLATFHVVTTLWVSLLDKTVCPGSGLIKIPEMLKILKNAFRQRFFEFRLRALL